jgi:hypothetical protein
MAQCEVCGNDYDKAFQVIVADTHPYLRQLRVRNPCGRTHLLPLRLPGHRPRRRGRRPHLLLRQLRQAGG